MYLHAICKSSAIFSLPRNLTTMNDSLSNLIGELHYGTGRVANASISTGLVLSVVISAAGLVFLGTLLVLLTRRTPHADEEFNCLELESGQRRSSRSLQDTLTTAIVAARPTNVGDCTIFSDDTGHHEDGVDVNMLTPLTEASTCAERTSQCYDFDIVADDYDNGLNGGERVEL